MVRFSPELVVPRIVSGTLAPIRFGKRRRRQAGTFHGPLSWLNDATDDEVIDAIRSIPTHRSKSNAFENALLLLLFNNTNIANIGDATGLRGSTAAGSLYFGGHTADPGEAGDQTTSEIAYTSYARVAVARSGAGFTVTANSVSPAAAVTFPAGTGGSGTITHGSIGTAASGAGVLLYSGTVTPNIVCGNGVTPNFPTTSALTED